MTNPVLECMKNRVSLRTYDDKPVTEEELAGDSGSGNAGAYCRQSDAVFHYCNPSQETKEKLSKS